MKKVSRMVPPHRLEPGVQHPLYWILTTIFGLTDNDICAAVHISKSVLTRIARGYTPKPPVMHQLLVLSRQVADIAASNGASEAEYAASSGERKCRPSDPMYAQHRRHIFELARTIASHYEPTEQLPRRSDLSDVILANLGTSGQFRSQVIARIRSPSVQASSIRRAARRIGVREIVRDFKPYWLPPSSTMRRIAPAPPPPEYRAPLSKRGHQLYNRLSVLLGRADDCTLPASTLVDQLMLEGFSRALIFRAAIDMRLVRHTTGFGTTKRTMWALPHVTPSAELPAEPARILEFPTVNQPE